MLMTKELPRAEILVVEDDHATRYLCDAALTNEGYSVISVGDGGSALGCLKTGTFDLLILDLNLPDMDGVELAHELRGKEGPPVLIMSTRSSPEQRVMGFDLGVADFLVKPFHPVELVHRVRRVLSQPSDTLANEQARGGWRLMEPEGVLLLEDGRRVSLTRGEAGLLNLLMRAQGRVVSRERLLHAVSRAETRNPKSVDVLISRLRRKLESEPASDDYIKTVPGIGYRLRVPKRTL